MIIDDNSLKGVISEAILTHMGEAARNEIIKEALKYVLTPTPPSSAFGSPTPSPIQRAFNDAVSEMARKLAKEHVMADERLKDSIRAMIAEAVEKSVLDRERIVLSMANAVSDAFCKR